IPCRSARKVGPISPSQGTRLAFLVRDARALRSARDHRRNALLIKSKSIRAPAQLAVGQTSVVANMCNRVRGHCAPMIDSFEQIHSETLINKGRCGEVTTAIHEYQARDNGEVIQNQQQSPQHRMVLDPGHACSRRWRSAMMSRGVLQLSRSNSAGETLMPSSFSIVTISSTVLIESST